MQVDDGWGLVEERGAGGRPNFWWWCSSLPACLLLLYFLAEGETGRMRPRTLICAAHHLRALCHPINSNSFGASFYVAPKDHSVMALISNHLTGTEVLS